MDTKLSNSATRIPPPRSGVPFDQGPAFYEPAGLWLYGNVKLLDGRLCHVPLVLGPPDHTLRELEEIEKAAEAIVFSAGVLVTGIHNAAHQRAAVVPLRWGSPRILVLSGGFEYHLGKDLTQEPFRAARLWRYQFDEKTDLVVSRRWPDRPPTFGLNNPTVDRLVARIALRQVDALLFQPRG